MININNLNVDKIYKEHINGNSCVTLANKYKVKPYDIRTMFHKQNLKIKYFSRRKNVIINDNFFEKIDTEIKAYLLGFIAADGAVTSHNKASTKYLEVGIHKKDVYIINLLKKYINPTAKIEITKKETQRRIRIASQKLFKDLENLGIIPNKTYKEIVTLEKIPEYLKIHFIRGFFDGDGTIGIYKVKDQYNRYNYQFNIISKKGLVLTHIMKELKTTLSLTYNIKTDMYKLSSNYKRTIKKLYKNLYANSNFHLKRKKNVFRKILLS